MKISTTSHAHLAQVRLVDLLQMHAHDELLRRCDPLGVPDRIAQPALAPDHVSRSNSSSERASSWPL